MSIPLATTTITVTGVRPQSSIDPDAEGYDAPAPAPTTLSTGVRACISNPTGSRSTPNDELDIYTLSCDPVDLNRFDIVLDETTGTQYMVDSVTISPAETFGLEHTKATLRLTKGLNGGGPNGPVA